MVDDLLEVVIFVVIVICEGWVGELVVYDLIEVEFLGFFEVFGCEFE